MAHPNHIALAISDALDLIDLIDVGDGEPVEISASVDKRYDGETASLTIATSDGCHFKVLVVRDE